MSKKENQENETYLVDAPKESRLRNWSNSKAAKITAISVGSALAIGAAFTGGVVAAKTVLPQQDGPGFAEGFDRDGDGPHEFDGQRPPKPGHDGDRDGDRDGGNGPQFQAPTTSTTTP